MAAADPLLDMTLRELRTTLYEELARLPVKNRTALVLCYLEGKTQAEAARLLGWTKDTVRGRLDRGREQLRKRLVHRGIALTSALFTTLLAYDKVLAVPAALLKATVKSAVLIAAGKVTAGAISTKVAALTSAGLKNLFLTKLKITLAIVLSVGAAGTGVGIISVRAGAGWQAPTTSAVAHQDGGNTRQPTQSQKSEPPIAAQSEPNASNQEMVTITGRVLDPDGKPLAGADVAAHGYFYQPVRSAWFTPPLFAKTKAGADGRFRLQVAPINSDRVGRVIVVAGSPVHSLTGQRLETDARQAEVELKLPAAQLLRGRLVDLQGQPAAGVQVYVTGIGGQVNGLDWGVTGELHNHLVASACWPKPATTNAKGQFALHGLAPNWNVWMKVQDDRFAPQELEINGKERKKGEEITLALAPVRIIEGTVTYLDTGKPAPYARVDVRTEPSGFDHNPTYSADSQANERGQFRVSLPIGSRVVVTAYAPLGAPYLGLQKTLDWPKSGVIKQEVNLSLPRGILARGTITEAASRKPVAGAQVEFFPNEDNNPFIRRDIISASTYRGPSGKRTCGPDGKFELVVLPGPGHLAINGPSLDYLHSQITIKQLIASSAGPNYRCYFDALVDLHLKPQAGPHEVTATLRRGVTLSGSVVDPHGRPVQSAVMVCRSHIPYGYSVGSGNAKKINGGKFELPGCDPDKTVEVFFVDPKNQLGAKVELSANPKNGKPITVRLEPCGKAQVRLLDEDGKPIANTWPGVQLVLTPGSPDDFGNDPTADLVFLAYVDQQHSTLKTDTEGRAALLSLIPGATYWLEGRGEGMFHKEFSVGAGETIDLGEIKARKKK